MPAPPVDPRKQARYAKLRQEGWQRTAACREVGVSESWAFKFDHGRDNSGKISRQSKRDAEMRAPISRTDLSEHAARGLDDFEFFRRHYLGHISTPWQVEAAYRLIELLESPHKEFVVLNCPPGAGKSTLATDFGTWVTCRDRTLRGLMGSRKSTNARRQVVRIRRSLERTQPYRAPSEEIEKGLAVDAKACLAADYGIFKPLAHADVWRAEEFVVAQVDDVPIEEKEPTWSSYGRDGGVLGNRFDLIFWDDLVDRTNTRTFELQADVQEWWDEEAETRLEPAGLLVLMGQRMHATDLYHFCLSKQLLDDPDDEEADEAAGASMYHHILYPAHDEQRCEGVHRRDKAQAWPDGCLLDPNRIPWRDLRKVRDTNSRRFQVLYQQQDGDSSTLFIRREWLSGGIDPDDMVERPGCYDEHRGLGELPPGLFGPLHSIVTIDPSVRQYWAIQWWVHAPDCNKTILMDLIDQKMTSDMLLMHDRGAGTWTGIMEDWQLRSVEMSLPITYWIAEKSSVFHDAFESEMYRSWQRARSTTLLPHTTSRTKLDPKIGPDIIRDEFKFGRIRLPRAQHGDARIVTNKLVDQLVHYGNMSRDDQVMACWFLFKNLDLVVPKGMKQVQLRRPSWLRRGAA